MAKKKEEYKGMFWQPTAEDYRRERKRVEELYYKGTDTKWE